MMIPSLMQFSIHKRIFLLALPMVLSNISVPLLGVVDAAVIGHLSDAWYLGGVALGSTLITVTFWLLGFLRMATTGIAAQAWGAKNSSALADVFIQGVVLSLIAAVVVILGHSVFSPWILSWSDASEHVTFYAQQYIDVRIWSAPASLINLVIMGWLLGTQNANRPMWLLMLVNGVNLVLDLLFVVVFDWKVQGVAAASVLADYVGLFVGLYFVFGVWQQQQLAPPLSLLGRAIQSMTRLLKLNRDIFLRSLCLQTVFTFVTFQGARLGDEVVAANAILMNFLMLISFAMDGFAYAMEAIVGKAVGERAKQALLTSLVVAFGWSVVITGAMTLIFWQGGEAIINLMSDIPSVREVAYMYLPWLIALPPVAMWCFLLDGIFIGATLGRDMRNTMFIALSGFFFVWWSTQSMGNHALWLAILSFMALRGVLLGGVFIRRWRNETFLVKIDV